MKRYNSLFAIAISITTIFFPCYTMDQFDPNDPMGNPNSWQTKSTLFQETQSDEQQAGEPAGFDFSPTLIQDESAQKFDNDLGTGNIGGATEAMSDNPIFMTIKLANRYLRSSNKTEKNKNLFNLVDYLHQPSIGWTHDFFKKINKDTIGKFFIIADDLRQPQPIYPSQEESDRAILQLKKDIYSKILPEQDLRYLTTAAKKIAENLEGLNISNAMLASYKADLADLLPALKKYVDDGQKNMIDVLLKAQETSNFRSDYIKLFLSFIYQNSIQEQIYMITNSSFDKEIKLNRLKKLFDLHQETDPRKILSETPQKVLNLWLKDDYAIKTAYEKLLKEKATSPNFLKIPSIKQQAAEKEEELSLLETNVNKLKNSLSRLASQYNVSEENTSQIVRQIKYFIPQIISFLKKYNGQNRIKELQQMLNAVTKKEYDNNIIESWIKQVDKIYQTTKDQISSPETFASSFISMQKDADSLFNNPDLQIEYLDKKAWSHEIKTYILQHLWLKARDESNLENMAIFRKKLRDIGEKTPTTSHIAGAVEIVNFEYVPEIPDDADAALVEIIENYYQTLRKNNKKQLSVISKNLTTRFNEHRKNKPNTFSIDWANKDKSLLMEYIKFLTFIDPLNKKLPWLKNELIKIETTITEFSHKNLLSNETALLKGLKEPSIEELEKYKASLEALQFLRPSTERENTIKALKEKIIEKRTAKETGEVARAQEQLKNIQENIAAHTKLKNDIEEEISTKQQQKAKLLEDEIEAPKQQTLLKAQQEENKQKQEDLKAKQEALEALIQEQQLAEELRPQIDELTKEFNELPAYTKSLKHFIDMVPYAIKITDFYDQYPNNKEVQKLYRNFEDKIAEDAAQTIMFLINDSSVRVTAPYYFNYTFDPYLKKWHEKYIALLKKTAAFESLENSELCNPDRYLDLSSDDALASLLTLKANLIKLGNVQINEPYTYTTNEYVKSLESKFIDGIKGNITPDQKDAFLATLLGVCETINEFSTRIEKYKLAHEPLPQRVVQLKPAVQPEPEPANQKPVVGQQPAQPQKAIVVVPRHQPQQPAQVQIQPEIAPEVAPEAPKKEPAISGWSYWLSTQPITDFFGWIIASRLNPFNWFK